MKWIEVRRTWSGLAYIVHGGSEHGRALSAAEYARLVDSGVPVVRIGDDPVIADAIGIARR